MPWWARLSRGELEPAADARRAASAVSDAVALERVPYLYPDLPVDAALRLLGARPLLPIVSRANPGTPVGAIRIQDVFKGYSF